MDHLTDSALDGIEKELASVPPATSAYCPDDTSSLRFHLHILAPRMISEIRRHRAMSASNHQKIRTIVEEIAKDTLSSRGPLDETWDNADFSVVIADRVAKQLATPAVRLSDDEVKQLQHHVLDHRACAYSCSIIERLLAAYGAKP